MYGIIFALYHLEQMPGLLLLCVQSSVGVPQLACNLFSVRATASKGNFIKFGHSRCWILGGDRKLYVMDTLNDNLYELDCQAVHTDFCDLLTLTFISSQR